MTGDGEVVVPADRAGERLDVALAALLDVPRARAAARIDAGEVTVDGRAVRRSHRVTAGERVVVAPAATAPTLAPPPPPPVRYRDDHLLVLAKPAGLVVHPGPGHAAGTLVDALLAAGVPLAAAAGPDRPGVVHRLDRDTSGLLVVASTDAAYAGLVDALRRRTVTRRYLAVVAGVPDARVGRIEAPIGRDPDDRKRFATVPGGKPATTRYVTVGTGHAAGQDVSLLACRLETGRTHQIRVHLTAVGHPVVGDPAYGPRPGLARALGLRRPGLHAGRLAFDHPVTGERIDVTEPVPDDVAAALAAAGIPLPDPAEVLGGDG